MIMSLKKVFCYSVITVFLILSTIISHAQTATVRGFVYDKETGEAVLFTNVIFKGTPDGSTTNGEGLYSISKVPPGEYTLVVTCLGYDSLITAITLKADEILNKKLLLTKGSIGLRTVEVSAQKDADKTKVQVGVTKITPADLKMIPSIGGAPDLAQ